MTLSSRCATSSSRVMEDLPRSGSGLLCLLILFFGRPLLLQIRQARRARTLQGVDHCGLGGVISRGIGSACNGHGAVARVIIRAIALVKALMFGGEFLV